MKVLGFQSVESTSLSKFLVSDVNLHPYIGEAAGAMGECEATWGRPIARRSKCVTLGHVLSAFGDCTERLTGPNSHEVGQRLAQA